MNFFRYRETILCPPDLFFVMRKIGIIAFLFLKKHAVMMTCYKLGYDYVYEGHMIGRHPIYLSSLYKWIPEASEHE